MRVKEKENSDEGGEKRAKMGVGMIIGKVDGEKKRHLLLFSSPLHLRLCRRMLGHHIVADLFQLSLKPLRRSSSGSIPVVKPSRAIGSTLRA